VALDTPPSRRYARLRRAAICLLAVAFLVAVALALFLVAPSAFAADITVTTTEDELTTNGSCSLREAIRNANADAVVHADCPTGAGADVIGLPPGVFRLTIPGREENAGSRATSTSEETWRSSARARAGRSWTATGSTGCSMHTRRALSESGDSRS
jgi:CSLREA domain-containing protein